LPTIATSCSARDLLQLHQLVVALGLLELVQAFALQVLDQLDLEDLLVAEDAHLAWMCARPACLEASQRRSPATISYLARPRSAASGRTTIGCSTPPSW
jgi:hypothetical protein